MRRHRHCTVPPRSVFVLAAVMMFAEPLPAQTPTPIPTQNQATFAVQTPSADSLEVQGVFDVEEIVVTARC